MNKVRDFVGELLRTGDTACARGDAEGLAKVCLQLCDEVDDRTAAAAVRIARLTRGDLITASLEWGELVTRLRTGSASAYDLDAEPYDLSTL
jgi:hypothetical protein